MWIIYAVLAGIFYTGNGLLTRRILKGAASDPFAFSFYFSAIGALVTIPFLMYNLKLPRSPAPWFFIAGVGVLVVIHNLMNFTSSRYLEASVSGTITKFRLVWTLIFGILLLNEGFLYSKLIGTILTVISGMIIIRRFNRPDKIKGVFLAFSATIVYALVVSLYKPLFIYFNSQTLTFFIFAIPAVINFLIIPNSVKRIAGIWNTDKWWIIIACSLGAIANLAMNKALSIGEVSRVPVVIESFLIATLVGENIWLKEREHLGVKITAALLAIAGAILIKL